MTSTPQRPFLLVQTRPEVDAALAEAEAVQRLGGFADGQLTAMQLGRDLGAAPDVRPDWGDLLARHAGVILPGSPYTTSDPEDTKSALQRRVESELARMLEVVLAEDRPFLGCCYGVGTLGRHVGALVDGTYGESAGPVTVTLTDEGAADPLLAGMPADFTAYVGHKEAVTQLPEGAVVLASGVACPVQMFRLGEHQYATQFHPELDQAGLLERLRIYAHHGYFAPEESDATFARIAATTAPEPPRILENFRRAYEG